MEDDNQIKALAEKIAQLKLTVPCLFLLEAHLPLCGVLHTFSLGMTPIFSGLKTISNIFSDPRNVELLIEELERQSKK